MENYNEFVKQGEDFRKEFKAFIKETLGEGYFGLVGISNTLGILSFSISVYKGDAEKLKSDNCYSLNAPHFRWHIQTGEYKYFQGDKKFLCYPKMSASLLRTSYSNAKYRKASIKTTEKLKAEPKQLFKKLTTWITKNKEELFRENNY